MRDATHPFLFDDANGKTPQAGDILRSMTCAYAAAVFAIVPIDNIMTTVLDAPVAAIGGEHTLRIGLFGGPTGDAIGGLTRAVTAFLICGLALDDKSLPEMRKVQIVV